MNLSSTRKDIHHIFVNKIQFGQVISSKTAYGLIWDGLYEQKPCVIKMIMLTTGLHYDKDQQCYVNHGKNGRVILEHDADQYFDRNDVDPFRHMEFKRRRSMTLDAFLREVANIRHLQQLQLAPHVFGYGVCDQTYNIHYGFIVMEKVDGSLKDIILTRSLHSTENALIKTMINQLHKKHHIIHGDLKPSNIGVYLDEKKMIKQCCFFDCQKMQYLDQLMSEGINELIDPSDLKKLFDKELANYKKHIIMNQQELNKS